MRRRAGFTLPELLVSVAIVGLLAAILVPTSWAVREKAVQLSCASRLRQLGLAFELYAQRSGGLYPHEDDGDSLPPFGSGWKKVLLPLAGNDDRMMRCPKAEGDALAASYKMNSLLEEGDTPFFVPGRARDPARTPLLFDGRIENPGVRRLTKGAWPMAAGRHRGATNILFLDGHVEPFEHPRARAGWPDPGPFKWWP